MLAGALSVTACGFMNAGGSAASRWARLEEARLAKANPSPDGAQICRTMRATGTNVPQRVCSTQAEWDATDAQNRADAENFSREMRSGNHEPGRDGVER